MANGGEEGVRFVSEVLGQCTSVGQVSFFASSTRVAAKVRALNDLIRLGFLDAETVAVATQPFVVHPRALGVPEFLSVEELLDRLDVQSGMIITPDANLLVYAYDEGSRYHAAARAWLEAALTHTKPAVLAWSVIPAFVRITTHPCLPAPIAIEEAAAVVDSVVTAARPHHRSHPTALVYSSRIVSECTGPGKPHDRRAPGDTRDRAPCHARNKRSGFYPLLRSVRRLSGCGVAAARRALTLAGRNSRVAPCADC